MMRIESIPDQPAAKDDSDVAPALASGVQPAEATVEDYWRGQWSASRQDGAILDPGAVLQSFAAVRDRP
jgi:hypothetical protein